MGRAINSVKMPRMASAKPTIELDPYVRYRKVVKTVPCHTASAAAENTVRMHAITTLWFCCAKGQRPKARASVERGSSGSSVGGAASIVAAWW